ncbi:MAG TPA: MFS transporter [Acidimicrobiales bacterium]|nr:MFS transporter [Acidimicrobiales bacterium]
MKTGTFASFSSRNFRLFFAGQMTSQIGSWMRMVAMSLLVLDITDNGVAVGVVTACQFAPVLVMGAWAGLVADRSDKRRLLLIAQACLMVQSFVLAALASMDEPPLLALCAVALAGGVATAFDNPARRSFVVEMVPEHHVQNAVSLNTAMMTGSRIFGPALAGVLIVATGYPWLFLIDGVSYVAVLAGLWLMRTDELRPAPPAARGKGQVREGLRYVRNMPELFIPLVMMTVVGTLAFNFSVVLPLFVTRSLDGSKSTFTYLFSVLSAGSMVGALWSARRTVVRLRHIVVATAAYGVTMFALAAAPTLVTAFPAAVLLGMASVVFMTTSTTMIQLRADPTMRGRVLALQAMVFLGSTPIGGPIVGWVSEAFGARMGLVVGAVACLGAAAYGGVAGRRLLERGRVVRDDVLTPEAELSTAV